MKTEVHPNYVESKIECSCGNTFVTRSTKGDMHLELCNECHPFFTGKQKLVDSGGRVERFQKRYGGQAVKSKKAQKAEAATGATDSEWSPSSIRGNAGKPAHEAGFLRERDR